MTVFLARELWRRLPGRAPTAYGGGSSAPYGAAAPNPERPEPPLAGRETERAVTSAPPLRLTRVGRRKPGPASVPAPR